MFKRKPFDEYDQDDEYFDFLDEEDTDILEPIDEDDDLELTEEDSLEEWIEEHAGLPEDIDIEDE